MQRQEHDLYGIYVYKSQKIKSKNGYSCFSLNKDSTVYHIIVSTGSFDIVSNERYRVSGDSIVTENWIWKLSQCRKVRGKELNRIERDLQWLKLRIKDGCIISNGTNNN
jgi:hypothetical protein